MIEQEYLNALSKPEEYVTSNEEDNYWTIFMKKFIKKKDNIDTMSECSHCSCVSVDLSDDDTSPWIIKDKTDDTPTELFLNDETTKTKSD